MALKQRTNRNAASRKSATALGRRGKAILTSLLLAAVGLGVARLCLTASAQTDAPQGRGSRAAGVTPKRPSRSASPSAGAAQKQQSNGAEQKGPTRAAADAMKSGDAAPNALESLSPLLAAADFDLIGLAVTASPEALTVPKNTPTSVLTSVKVPEGSDPAQIIAGLNTSYRVRGELTGPSFTSPRTIEAKVGQPLPVPALAQAGDHLLQNLRVVDISQPGEYVVAPVTPDAVGVVVIERLLVSEVHVNELTYEQIVQAGINITDDNYQAFNFTLGIGTISDAQTISIPVAFPPVGVTDPRPVIGTPSVSAPGISVPTVVPVLLTPDVGEPGAGGAVELPQEGEGVVRIPGVVIFPGRVGFLHQFFEAIVIVANGAPDGTPLVLRNLHARAKLPNAGTPGVESDDPLRIAETQLAGRVSEMDLHGLGPDGKWGTGDDTMSFSPGQSGQGTFLLEGLKEGLHTVDFDLTATLDGLPSGPVNVKGEVPGAVLVRDASFAVTFTHPGVVRAGQEYDLAMTVTNTGSRDISGAFARLPPGSISGAEFLGTDTGLRQFATTIKRRDSATVKWRLRSNTTGAVTASYVKVGEDVSAGLQLVTGVGDRNVPLSPDSLILPDPVRHLPPDFVEAARAVLGQAWSVANAPPGSLPSDVAPITKQNVVDRAVELGLAGMRVDFGEPAGVSIDTLVRDWLGELKTDDGFADALRATPSGNTYYDAVGTEIYKRMTAAGGPSAADIHRELAETESSRSQFVSAIVTGAGGQQVAGVRLSNAAGQKVGFGATAADARAVDSRAGGAMFIGRTDANTHTTTNIGQMVLMSKTGSENHVLELFGWQTGTADISLLYPASGRTYRHVTWGGVQMTEGGKYRVSFRASGSAATVPVLEVFESGVYVPSTSAGTLVTIEQPAPRLVGAVQVTPDVVAGGDKYGRLVGLLFSKPMLKEQAESVSKYAVGGGQLKNTEDVVGGPVNVKGARIDYGDRFVFLALDSPIGPYIRRDVTVSGMSDARRLALAPTPTTMRIDPRVSPQGKPPGAYLTGRVINADGTPVPNAPVVYWTQECPDPARAVMPPPPIPLAVKYTDALGRYAIDYVRDGDCAPLSVTVTNPLTKSEKRLTSPVAYDGQHMVFDMVFLARGNVRGTITSGGVPVPKAFVSIVPTLDVVGRQVVQTDDSGNYSATGVPVGNVSIFAVGTGDYSLASGFAAGNIDGPNLTAVVNVSMQNVGGGVAGRVLRGDGKPSSGALVVAYAVIPGVHSLRGDGATAVGYVYADRDGRFNIDKIPVSDVTLEVTDYVTGARASQRVILTTQNPVITGVLLTLPGYGSVSGRVVDETGAPVPKAYVSAAGGAVLADESGNYLLQNLPAGTHQISATNAEAGRSGSARAEVHIGETTENVTVVILRPASVMGRVFILEEGSTIPKPLAGVYVTSNGYDLAQTDAQGNYKLPYVSPNTHITLRFIELKKSYGYNLNVRLSPGETLTRDVTFRPGTIRGRVTQPDGVTGVVADINVYAPKPHLKPGPDLGLLMAENPAVTRTGADGSYTVSGNNPGAFRVSTSNVFFPTPVSAGGVLAPSGTAECNLSLVSTLAGKIQGRVYQPDGTTPVGANVRVTLGGGSLADATVRTDETGHYEFGEVFSAGSYSLTATDPVTGYTNRISVAVQKNQDAVFDLRLLGNGSLRVKVIDGGGQPVHSGSISVDGSAYPYQRRFAEITDASAGVVVFDNLPEGAYAVSATNMGLGGRGAVNVSPGSTVETTIQLLASGAVQGGVYMPGGATPVGLADVRLTAGGRIIGFSVTSDDAADAGKFQFLNVPAGTFTLDVFDNRTGRVGRSYGTITAQGEVASVNVELLSQGAVAGRVTANGVPIDHALVEISSDGSGLRSTHLKATTDPDGRYRFTGIPAGRFTINVRNAPGGQTGSVSGTVSGTNEPLPDTIADIALEPSQTVTGTVYKLGGTEPVPGALVTLDVNGRQYKVTANEQGVYRATFVPLGQVRVRANAPAGNDRGEAAPVAGVTPGGSVNVNVSFAGTGSVTGLATDNNGTPLQFGTVTFVNDAWGRIEFVRTVRSDGTYQVNDVPVGDFTLRLTVPDRFGVGTAAGAVSAGQTSNVAIRIEDAGRVRGRVISENGSAGVPGADVTLTLWRPAGMLTFYTHSDAQGVWVVENVPLGVVTARVFDPVTESAARVYNAALSANAQELDLGDMRLHQNKYGAVAGTVVSENGQPVAGAAVVLNAPNGTFTATTAADGRFHFEPVDLGAFTVEATDAAGLRDTQAGQLSHEEQTTQVNPRLVARGTVTGTVTRPDGTTPVAGAQVLVRRNSAHSSPYATLTTDAQGVYRAELVQHAPIFVDVTDPATGERGHAEGDLTTNGQTLNVNVPLRGLGQVTVTVTNASGAPVAGARVTLTTPDPFQSGATLTTQANGAATFAGVISGDFNVSVHDPASDLHASGSGTVAAGGTAALTLALQATGSITGRVFLPDGTTPAAGVKVTLSPFGMQTTTGVDGAYRFDNLTLRGYSVSASTAGHTRARSGSLALNADGQVITQDLTLEPVGSVTGRVTNPDGSAAAGLYVNVRSNNAQLGTVFNSSVQTDAEGAYHFGNVIAGLVTATVSDDARHLYGTTSNTLSQDGQVLTLDLQLVNFTLNLPQTRYDANNFPFAVSREGAIRGGQNNVFYGNGSSTASGHNGGFRLVVESGGTSYNFTGSAVGSGEEGGREIAIGPQTLGGVEVTRKVYVPREGYFVRYLELLRNPTAAPMTVAVQVQTNFRNCNYYYDGYCGNAQLVSTSSGDDTLGVSDASNPDRWAVIDNGYNQDPFYYGDIPATAYAFDGAGAQHRVSHVQMDRPASDRLMYRWQSITIQPGQTVAYMHFGVQQTSQESARASAERLTQLPPEAIAGLSAEERGEIRNFAVPADGASALAALPPLTGAVTGRVLSGDLTTGIDGAGVTFKSDDPIFARKYSATTNADGAFGFTSVINDNGTSVAIPAAGFRLNASNPRLGSQAPEVHGSFPEGQTTVAQDIVFPDTSNLRGVVRRHNGVPVTSGAVSITNPQANVYTSVDIAADGSYSLKGAPPGEYALMANVAHVQGNDNRGSARASVAAGQTAVADITLAPTGAVTGIVRSADGAPASDIWVRLANDDYGYYFRYAYTDASGRYTLTDVPAGDYRLIVTEPNTGTENVVPVTVRQDETATRDVTMNGVGSVDVTVTYQNGAPAVGSEVYIQDGSSGSHWGGSTDEQGHLVITNVATGPVKVTAYSPGNTRLSTEVSGTLATNGGVLPLTVKLPPSGKVRGHVTLGDGSPAVNAQVRLVWQSNSTRPGYTIYTGADANGDYEVENVEVGRAFTVRVTNPVNSNFQRVIQGQILTADGQTLDVNVTFEATADLRIKVLRADGSLTPNVYVYVRDKSAESNNNGERSAYTGAGGVATVRGVQVGPYSVYALDPSNGYSLLGSAEGVIEESQQGQTIDVTINPPFTGTVIANVSLGGRPRPNLYVELTDAASGRGVGYAYSDERGEARAENVTVGAAGFRAVAHLPSDYDQTAGATGAFTANGQTVAVDITLPGGVISGRVFYADGVTPVQSASVWASQREGEAVRLYYAEVQEGGKFIVEGVRVGEFDLYAQADGTPLTSKVSGRLDAENVPVTLNVTLPPSGTVRGVVRDTAGAVVPNAEVTLTQGDSPTDFRTTTDEQGAYLFERISAGNFYVQAKHPETGVFGSAVGSLDGDGETATADITFPATTTVTGLVTRADGVTPLPNAQVYVENFTGGGAAGRFMREFTANASGRYTAADVPVGLVRVVARNPQNHQQVGQAETTLASADPATVNVALGNVLNFDYVDGLLSGADNFRYHFYGDGGMDEGGTLDGTLGEAYNGAFYLTLQDENWYYSNSVHGRFRWDGPAIEPVGVEDGGREYAFGYDSLFGLLLKRKLFVPESGGYARYLEVLSNPTDKPVTVLAGVDSWFGYLKFDGTDTRYKVLVGPSQTDNTYAVTEFNDKCCYPLLAHVFAGPDARMPTSDARFWNIDNDESRSLYRWDLTVQPGQTVIFMHFTAQRRPGDIAGAQTQAQSLVALSDPHALDGMTAEERAQVVNFRLAGTGAASVGKVNVQANYDGGQPAANAPVYIREGGSTRQAGRTNAQGRLTIGEVPVGPFTVKVYNPTTSANFAEGSGTIPAAGESAAVTVTLTAYGSASGRVTNANQTALADALVELSGQNVPARSVKTDGNGAYAFAGLPLNQTFTVKVTRPDDIAVTSTSAPQTIAAPGGVASLDFSMPMWSWVSGYVLAGDGQTPVPLSNVEVFDAATGESMGTYVSVQDGYYMTGWLLIGRQGVRVRATRTQDSEYIGELTAAFPAGESAVVNTNPALPIPVITGTVTRADDTPVAFPQVQIRQQNASGPDWWHWVYNTDAEGHYWALARHTGDFELSVTDPDGSTRVVSGNAQSVTTPTRLDVKLPDGGLITGTVFDSAGARVANANVRLSSSGTFNDRSTSTDEQGNFRLAAVTPGNVFVQVGHPDTAVNGIGFGASAVGQTSTINVTLPATGTVRGTVFRPGGSEPFAGARLVIENFAGAGGNGHFTLDATSDAEGKFDVAGAQTGQVRVTAFDPSDESVAGVAEVAVTAAAPAQVNVTLGTAVGFDGNTINLDGADGFRYDIYTDGDLTAGGTSDGTLLDAYWGSHYLTLDDNWWFWNKTEVAATEDGGRELVIGSDAWGGVYMTRKIYVPAAGGFARYLDVLRNTSDRPLTYRMGIDGWTGLFEDTRVSTAPADTSNTYVVMTDDAGTRPSIAEVMAGPGASVPVSLTSFGQESHFVYGWNVTIQPGQTVILMHFAVQREPADSTGARTQAESLVNLSDPRALDGMTADERSQVVNFVIPTQAGVRNEKPDNTSQRKPDAVRTRRDGAGAPAVSSTDRRSAEAAPWTAPGLRPDRVGRQGLQKR